MTDYKSPRGRNGLHKANSFASFAKEFGWNTKVSSTQEDDVRLFARRGDSETLNFVWINGCWSGESHYTLAGEKIKCHNLSAASKIVQGKPDPDRLRKATRKLKRQTGIEYSEGPIKDSDIDSLRGSLPFDDESSDEDIQAVLHKRSITWVNTTSGQVQYSVRVDVDKQFKIVRKKDNEKIKADFITFCSTEGYRAIYLRSIVAVN